MIPDEEEEVVYIDGTGAGPTVVELPSTSEEPPLVEEPPKHPYEQLMATYDGADGLEAHFNVSGGTTPYMFDYGDGTSDEDMFPGTVSHVYPAAGSYFFTVTDSANVPDVFVEQITIDDPEAPLPRGEWEDFKQHQQFDDWWDQQEPELIGDKPDDWNTMTIAKKKAWLTENME